MPNASAPSPRQYKRTQERRQEILVAAVELLSTPSCCSLTTKEIAKFLGIADGALYRHFSGKTEILAELVGFCRNAFDNMFETINAESGVPLLEKAKVKARALLLFAEANPGLTRLLTGEALFAEDDSVKAAMQETLGRVEKALAGTLELAAMHHEIRSDVEAGQRAALIMSFVEGGWVRFAASGFTQKPSDGWQQAQDVLFSGLQP